MKKLNVRKRSDIFKHTETQCSNCGSSSVGRALAFQAKGRGFESRLPLTRISKSRD